MLLELLKWLFINLMVAFGLNAVAAHPQLFPRLKNTAQYPWRDVVAYTVMAILCMLIPWVPQPGLQLDLRNIVIGLTGWIHGLRAAAPVAAVVVALRLMIGGPGIPIAILTTSWTFVLVLFVSKRPRTPLWLAIMGGAQAIGILVAFQTVLDPTPAWAESKSPVWLALTPIWILSYVMLNSAHEQVREMERLREVLARELRAKEALLELIPYGILLLDEHHRATGLNQAGRNLLAGAEVPRPILEHPDINQALWARRRLSGCRVTYPGDEGRESIVLVSAVPVENGAVLGIQNVTTVVRQERETAERERLELLGHLAAMAAHEIKNPLTTIKGFLQLLEAREEFATHRSAFSLLQGEVEHINRVVSDFLLLSGKGSKKPVAVDLDALLQEVVEAMKLQNMACDVQVSLEGEEGLVSQADLKSLTQILKNLVVNAYEAMPCGGRLTLVRERHGDMIRITVADTGQGIPPDVLSLIFRPYMTTKATGTGLGLAISHKLASEMGGSLEVSSEVGKGSAFRLLLPDHGIVPSVVALGAFAK